MEDKRGGYCYLPYEEWCALLSTIKVKYNKKIAADNIKKHATYKSTPVNSDRHAYIKVTYKKKGKTGALQAYKQHDKKTSKHHGGQNQCVLCQKLVMYECKWILHSSKNCFGKRSDQASANDGLGGDLDNRADSINNYQKNENKWKREL